MSAPLLTSTDDEVFASALRRLRRAERAAEEAKSAVAEAKDHLATTLHAATAGYRDGEAPLPVDLLRTLYWDEPSLRVRDIASAFGLRQSALVEVVGPRTVMLPCTRCGEGTEVLRFSRSDTRRELCPHCHAVSQLREIERRAREAVWRERDRDRWDPPPWEPDLYDVPGGLDPFAWYDDPDEPGDLAGPRGPDRRGDLGGPSDR